MSNAHHEELIPGKVPEEQFELLLAGTSIRSEVLIAALRDHLVHGLRATDAWEKPCAFAAEQAAPALSRCRTGG